MDRTSAIAPMRSTDRLLSLLDKLGLVVLLAMPLMMFLGIAVCDAAIVAIAVMFVIRSVLTRDFAWLNTRWLQVGLVLWVYLIMISFYAVASTKLSLKQAVPFGRFLFFAAGLQYWLLDNERNRRYLLYAMGFALIFISFDVIFTFLTGLSIVGKSAVQYHASNHITWIWQRQYSRIVGLNGKMNNGIMLAWMSMPFLVYMLMTMMKRTSTAKVMLSGLTVLFISVAVLVTGERMALLELCLGYVLVFIFIKPLRKVLFIVAMACLVVGIAALWHSPGLWDRNVTQITQAITTLGTNDYGRIFRASMQIFADHPIFGIGLKQYYLISLLPQYVPFNAINSHVQNMYLEFITGTGTIGTLLFAGLLYFWIKQFWQGRAALKASVISIAVLIAFILRIWPLASTTSIFFAWGGMTFWWMAAWLLALTKEKHNVKT
jgi:O-antigen ligase